MSVSATDNAGGFIGYSGANTSVNKATNMGSIGSESDNTERAGGIVGYVTDVTNISLNSCFNGTRESYQEAINNETWSSYPKITGSYAGGFVGRAYLNINGNVFINYTSSGSKDTSSVKSGNYMAINPLTNMYSAGIIGSISADYNTSTSETKVTTDKYLYNLYAYNLENYGNVNYDMITTGGLISIFEGQTLNVDTFDNYGQLRGFTVGKSTAYIGGITGCAYRSSLSNNSSYTRSISNISLNNCHNHNGYFYITSTQSNQAYAGGLIGYLEATTVTISGCSNTVLEKFTGIDASGITIDPICGGLIAEAWIDSSFSMTNCSSNAFINSMGNAGGLIAVLERSYDNDSATFTITDCTNRGEIGYVGGGGWVGGIIGRFQPDWKMTTINIARCHNYGILKGYQAAGIIGYFGGYGVNNTSLSLSSCTNNADILTTDTAGGIISTVSSVNLTISSCTSNKFIIEGSYTDAYAYAGGIVGYMSTITATISSTTSNAQIKGYYAGGIVGYLANSSSSKLTLTNCKFNGNISDTIPTKIGYYWVPVLYDYSMPGMGSTYEDILVIADNAGYTYMPGSNAGTYYYDYIEDWYNYIYLAHYYDYGEPLSPDGYMYKIGSYYSIYNAWYLIGHDDSYGNYFYRSYRSYASDAAISTYAGPYIGNGSRDSTYESSVYNRTSYDSNATESSWGIPSYNYNISGCSYSGAIITRYQSVTWNRSHGTV